MSLTTVFFIALSMAMDAFAVSLGSGVKIGPGPRPVFRIAFHFGLFQALLPILGWLFGNTIEPLVNGFDHWVAFALLSAIGIKMLYEAFKKSGEKKINITRFPTLLILSVATSIDALVVGITLPLLEIPLYLSVIIIGFFAFMFSITGYFLGHRIGKVIGNKMEIIGGTILIGIGIKLLIEHLL